MLWQVIHSECCLASERPHKIVSCKNELQIRNLISKPSDMITQLWGISIIKQRDLCITVQPHPIRVALSHHGTYVCSKCMTHL